jgi:hypothetical protein
MASINVGTKATLTKRSSNRTQTQQRTNLKPKSGECIKDAEVINDSNLQQAVENRLLLQQKCFF